MAFIPFSSSYESSFNAMLGGNVTRTRLLYTAAIMQMEITPLEHDGKQALHTYFGDT